VPQPVDQQQRDKQQLEALMKELQEAISKSQALEPFKDQLLLDLTPEGLRIQIVDKQNRPMFDLGSATLKPYTQQILHELAST
jgi:chemotaxis protein MotB